jgi:hypothetical protein
MKIRGNIPDHLSGWAGKYYGSSKCKPFLRLLPRWSFSTNSLSSSDNTMGLDFLGII